MKRTQGQYLGAVSAAMAGAALATAAACGGGNSAAEPAQVPQRAATAPPTEGEPGASPAGKPPAVEPTGKTAEILERIEGWETWSVFPDYVEAPVQSEGHDDMFVIAYYNDTAAPAVPKETRDTFPVGSLLVKENRPQPDAPAAAITTISKEADGWYWIKSTPDGKVMTDEDGAPIAGDVDSCTGCHASARDDDMVFSGEAG